MCHTPSLMNINWRDLDPGGHFLIISSHILSLWSDWFDSLWRPFSPHTCGAKLLFFVDLFRAFYCSINQGLPCSTLGCLTSKLCQKSDFRRPYSWALKSRNSGLFDWSPKLLRWLFCCCLSWIFCAVFGLTSVDLWCTVFEGCGCDTWRSGWSRKTLLVEASCWPS